MASIRVTGVQMTVSLNLSENLARILQHIENTETDYILFPEMALTGRHDQFGQKAVERAWEQIATACRQSYTTAVVGTGATQDGAIFMQSRVFSDEGDLIGSHEKLIPTIEDRTWCRPGEELRVFNHNSLCFGCLIGNDMWAAPGLGPYPDRKLAYQLAQQGAVALFHSLDTGADPDYQAFYASNLLLRAKESRCYIFTANAACADADLNVPSGVVSPEGKWLTKCLLGGEDSYGFDLELE